MRKRRESFDISPRWSVTLGEKTSLQMGYSHAETNFPDAEDTGLFGFTSDSADVTLSYQFNPKIQFLTVLNASYFDNPDLGLKTDNYGFTLGISHHPFQGEIKHDISIG